METTIEPGPRTAKATRAAQLAAQRKRARYLTDRGWVCYEPGTAPANVPNSSTNGEE